MRAAVNDGQALHARISERGRRTFRERRHAAGRGIYRGFTSPLLSARKRWADLPGHRHVRVFSASTMTRPSSRPPACVTSAKKTVRRISFIWRYDSGLAVTGVPDVAAALTLTPAQQVDIGFSCGSVVATIQAPIRTCTGIGRSTLLTLPHTAASGMDLGMVELS